MLRKNIPNRAGKPVEYNNDRTVAPFRIVKEEEEGNESHEEILPRKKERNILFFPKYRVFNLKKKRENGK